jgi:DNA-binding transcriptional regulator YiaG
VIIRASSEARNNAIRAISSGSRVHVVEVPDVRAIRRKLHLSQQEFAQKYRTPCLH